MERTNKPTYQAKTRIVKAEKNRKVGISERKKLPTLDGFSSPLGAI